MRIIFFIYPITRSMSRWVRSLLAGCNSIAGCWHRPATDLVTRHRIIPETSGWCLSFATRPSFFGDHLSPTVSLMKHQFLQLQWLVHSAEERSADRSIVSSLEGLILCGQAYIVLLANLMTSLFIAALDKARHGELGEGHAFMDTLWQQGCDPGYIAFAWEFHSMRVIHSEYGWRSR